jgi:hypothetical protein
VGLIPSIGDQNGFGRSGPAGMGDLFIGSHTRRSQKISTGRKALISGQ